MKPRRYGRPSPQAQENPCEACRDRGREDLLNRVEAAHMTITKLTMELAARDARIAELLAEAT